jgi:hypothetical protein
MKSESSKRISLLNLKTIDSEIKNLKESIEKSETFRQKLKEKSKSRVNCIALSGNSINENFLDYPEKLTENKYFESSSKQTTPTSKKVLENYGKFSINLTGVSKSSRNYFNRKEEEYNPYKTNYGISSRNTIDNIYESFDQKKKKYAKSGVSVDFVDKNTRTIKLPIKLPDLNTRGSSNLIKSPTPNKKPNSNYYANTASSRASNKKVIQTNQNNASNDMESKLIYSKVFNKKYDFLQNCEKKVLAKEALLGKDLTYEKQLYEMKSKIHLIREVYNYAYPKIMIEKVRQIKKNLGDSKSNRTVFNKTNKSQSSKEQVTITHSKINFYL